MPSNIEHRSLPSLNLLAEKTDCIVLQDSNLEEIYHAMDRFSIQSGVTQKRIYKTTMSLTQNANAQSSSMYYDVFLSW